jgi:hypothetical protein
MLPLRKTNVLLPRGGRRYFSDAAAQPLCARVEGPGNTLRQERRHYPCANRIDGQTDWLNAAKAVVRANTIGRREPLTRDYSSHPQRDSNPCGRLERPNTAVRSAQGVHRVRKRAGQGSEHRPGRSLRPGRALNRWASGWARERDERGAAGPSRPPGDHVATTGCVSWWRSPRRPASWRRSPRPRSVCGAESSRAST